MACPPQTCLFFSTHEYIYIDIIKHALDIHMKVGLIRSTKRKIQMCAGGTGRGGVRGWKVGPSFWPFGYLLMNEAALNQLHVNMHDLEEEGNANGFVCLSVCLPGKVVWVAAWKFGLMVLHKQAKVIITNAGLFKFSLLKKKKLNWLGCLQTIGRDRCLPVVCRHPKPVKLFSKG